MADTGKRMAGPAFLAASATTLYTVPASTMTILRYVRLVNNTASAVAATLTIGADTAATRFLVVTVPANSAYDWTGMVPLADAEVIQGYADTDTSIIVIAAGVEVS